MDFFEKPIFSDTAVPKTNLIYTADFNYSSPWGDCDISFTWTNSDFNSLHNHHHWELVVIVDGKICHSLNGSLFNLSHGDACLIRPNDTHCFKNPNASYQQINFLIKAEYLKKYLSSYSDTLYESLLSDPMPLSFKIPENQLQSTIYKMLSLQMTQGGDTEKNVFHAKIIFSSLLADFLEQKFSYTNSYPQWLKNLFNELNKPNTYKLSANEIAMLTPYSYSRLCYLFKKYTNKTLNEYMINLKLLHAQEQLKYTNKTTLEISNEIGFSSLSHFNHIFKKNFNTTPSQYRSQFKKNAING